MAKKCGCKELSWSKKDLDEFVRKSRVVTACLIMSIIEFVEITKRRKSHGNTKEDKYTHL